MKVKNQKCIRRLSYKSLWATRKRNVIAIFAIALTTLLFTSLFTILMSLNESYETYNFRQVGGYSDGTFKEVSEEQVEEMEKEQIVVFHGFQSDPRPFYHMRIQHHRCFWKSSGRSQLHG